jgi:hypothetical protein
MSNIVSFHRKKEKLLCEEIQEFIEDHTFVIVRTNKEDRIDVMSNLSPGIHEATLIHAAYIFSINEME